MKYLFIGREPSLAKEIRRLEKAGWTAREMAGAIHHGAGTWTFPLELTKKEAAHDEG